MGVVKIQESSTTVFSFPKAFPSQCFVIVGSQRINDGVDTLMIQHISRTEFEVTVSGGIGSEEVSFIAIGIGSNINITARIDFLLRDRLLIG